MSVQPPILPFYSPGVQSLIPMFYVAWSDQVLSPAEVKLLKDRVLQLGFLDDAEKAILQQWLNPSTPPSRELYKHWELELQKAANKLPVASRKSLVDLGLSMAKQTGIQYLEEERQLEWFSPNTRSTLEELEELLGVVNLETYNRIFQDVESQDDEQALKREETKARFDVVAMTALLQGQQADLIQRVKTLFKDPTFERRVLRDKEVYRAQVLRWLQALANQGWGALAYPIEHGGQNAMKDYITVFETIGLFDMSLQVKFGVQFGLFGGSIAALGTEKHYQKYLRAVGTLELPGCFAMTETGHGSNVRQLETTATFDPVNDEFIIHSPRKASGKEYIGNALHGKIATVFCQLIVKGENHGIHALLVPLRNEKHELLAGITVEDNGYKLGLNGVDNGRIWFDQVRIPRENLLNRFGEVDENGSYQSSIENPSRRFFTMLGTLVGGRVCVPRAALTAAKLGLSIAIKYALKRRQFGPSFTEPETLILDYPSHQKRLMPLLAKAYAIHFALDYLTGRYLNRTEEDIREIETLAAGLKAYATWFTTATLQECREACGGRGYLWENRFADLKADTEIYTTFEGDNTVLMQLVARGVLTKFRSQFNEEGMMGVLRFIGGRLVASIADKDPITIRNNSLNHLMDSDMHLQAFRNRENHLKFAISLEMRNLIKQKHTAYEAAIKCQNQLLELGAAFIEKIVLREFVNVVDRTENLELKSTLKHLCDLYALSTIDQHHGWYLENGYMRSPKTTAIRKVVQDLCADVRVDALALVNALDVSEGE